VNRADLSPVTPWGVPMVALRPESEELDDHDPTDRGESSGRLLPIARRDVVRGIGGLGLASALGGLPAATAAAEQADTSQSVDDRIQEHRTGDLEVVVENDDGSTVEGADVSIAQQSHEFDFGTAVNAGTLIEDSGEGDEYREYIPELFNTAVIENQMKWAFWEDDPQLADDAVDWLLDQGLDVRGHVCLWGSEGVGAIPSDVQTAIEERDAETIRDRSMQHVEDVIAHYGEDVTEWEVVNEAMHVFQLQLGVYGDRIDQEEPWTGDVVPWTSELLADWYSHAADVVEDEDLDVGLAVNDFNQFAYAYTDGRYENEIDHINENAVQLDTVGLQAHVAARTGEFDTNSSPDGRISADQVVEEMNQWADHGARLKITEFDTYGGGDWNSDEERATVLRNYLRGAFSHPGCDAFLMWGFWDGRHWEDEAPLFYEDWSEKPAYDVWTGLLFDEWWTEETGSTDASGTYATTAYLGEYEVEVTTDAGATTTTTSVTDASGTTTVTVTADGEGSGSGDESDDESDDGDGTDDADGSTGDSGSGSESEGDGLPGFGIAAGLAGLAGAARLALSGGDESASDAPVDDEA